MNFADTSGQIGAGAISFAQVIATLVCAGTVYTDVIYHQNAYAEAYADVTAITSIEATATWVTVSAALTAVNKNLFSVSGHDLTYTGTVTAKFMVNAACEARGSANQQLWVAVTKNGTPVSGTISKGRHISLDVANRTAQGVMELKTNDIISMQMQVPDGPIASPEVFGVKYLLVPVYWG